MPKYKVSAKFKFLTTGNRTGHSFQTAKTPKEAIKKAKKIFKKKKQSKFIGTAKDWKATRA